MSVTVRLWSDADLEAIKSGKDKLLATIFMNVSTFCEREIKCYPYGLRRTFICRWFTDNPKEEDETITVYATDVNTLKQFLNMEYVRLPNLIDEQFTQYKPITLK